MNSERRLPVGTIQRNIVESDSTLINEEIMENVLDFVVYPAHVANGTITRDEIMTRMMEVASNCDLTAIDKLRFYRELEKAAGAAVKAIDKKYDMCVDDAAVVLDESLPEVQKIIAEARAEEVDDGEEYDTELTKMAETATEKGVNEISAGDKNLDSEFSKASKSTVGADAKKRKINAAKKKKKQARQNKKNARR